MKVKSKILETLRFAFTRRIKGADGKIYKYRAPEIPYNVRRHMIPQYHYCIYMFYMIFLVRFSFPVRLTLEDFWWLAGMYLIFAIPFRFATYRSAILGKSDLWETDTVPNFGYHIFREAIRGTFLFHCKDTNGVSHHLSIKKYGLITLPLLAVLVGEYYLFRYESYAEIYGTGSIPKWALLFLLIIPLILYVIILDAYMTVGDRRSVWEDPDDTEGGSEYKL